MKLNFETLENKELLAGDLAVAAEHFEVIICNVVYPQTCYVAQDFPPTVVDAVFEQIGGRRTRTVRQTWS